ncbi:MAG TPA: limonene-1,2-epoxide hydrolase family protein [Solirubrobacteraceae bacterium]|jgi:limonene-1,2-epoxide hydrolase|nr:limonene-1,2-epoxide hydrolase family protein [Solirubrobacteraceae bacterium]
MPDPLTPPDPSNTAHQEPQPSPAQVVERFLEQLRARDIDAAAELLASDVEYINVGLPTVWGRERVRRLLRATLGLEGAGFEVYLHTISADGPRVLTERTDVMKYRGLRIQFWVCGRFDVRDGEIVLWRDYFDQLNFWLATARGLLGTVLPVLRAKPPIV